MIPPRQHLIDFTAQAGVLSYGEWTAEALFGEPYGYYRQRRQRVGTTEPSDFATNLQHAPALAPLLHAAWVEILGERRVQASELFLIGEEPDQSLAPWFPAGAFRAIHSLPYGTPWPEAEQKILFANEVLDAQPFERFIWDGALWRQAGVGVENDEFIEVLLEVPRGEGVAELLRRLPESPRPRQAVDLSPAASCCLGDWLRGTWKGLFFTLDYGHFWETLLSEFPEGTARGYIGHRQEPNPLSAGGVGDLTCHVCWDLLLEVLQQEGFTAPDPLRQDRFFFRYGQRALAQMMSGVEPGRVPDSLLGHAKAVALPGSLGSRFHALWGLRS